VDAAGVHLTWTAPRRLPVTDARVEVHADGRLLGVARVSADGSRLRLTVPAGAVADWTSLQVSASGRRLDVPATRARLGSAPAPSPTTTPTTTPLPPALDPGVPGPFATREGEYTLAPVRVGGLSAPVEMQAVVLAPVAASGPRPFALFLHGRHWSCYLGGPHGDVSGEWPCPTGWRAVPSYRGYLQTQRLLASQGWLTVSISANGINGQDYQSADGGAAARSELVRAHLARWARWASSGRAWASAPAAVRAGPRPDLGKVLLIGHSRGGEGVNRAALDSTTGRRVPWRIGGQVLIAPTAFGRNPAPGVPSVVLLPYCDGDVFDLQGQSYLDDSRDLTRDPALRSAVLVLGADHNFFNLEWTPGAAQAPAEDDWWDASDPVCGSSAPGRLSAGQQRAVGATYVAAAARTLVQRNAAVAPLLDGSPVRAPSAGSARVLAHALGGLRTPLLVPGRGVGLSASAPAEVRSCDTVDPVGGPGGCVPEGASGAMPHFLPLAYIAGEPTRHAVDLRWSGGRGSVLARLPRPVSLAGATELALRVIAEPGGARARFAVRVGDAAGRAVTLGVAEVAGLPGPGASAKYWAQEVRVPLNRAALAAAGVDAERITKVALLARSPSGRLWVLDVSGRRPGLSRAAPVRLPRIDVGRTRVLEGDRGTRTVTVPVTVTGTLRAPARVWVGAVDLTSFTSRTVETVTVPPGTRRIDVPFEVVGNTLDDFDISATEVVVEAVRGVATGTWKGYLEVLDDDPTPTLSVTGSARTVEGGTLRWHLEASRPSNVAVAVPALAVPPGQASGGPSGRELSTADVPADWLAAHGVDPSAPPQPLSAAGVSLFFELPPGRTSAELEIPTVADRKVEGLEKVVLAIPGDGQVRGMAHGAVLTGLVTDPTS
jgi:hypothetical protein